MAAEVRVGTDDDGRPVVVKVARPGVEADRLAREAALLGAARHPGVVEVVEAGDDEAGGFRLVTSLAGTRTLTDAPTEVTAVAGLVAATATTVADLHTLGVVHGRLEPAHVVIAAEGRPVLCGFAGGGRAGTTPPGAPGPLTPPDDVAALGALLRGLLERGDAVAPAGPAWRRTSEAPARRALLALADQARHDDPSRRPTAAALATAVRVAVPDARLEPAPELARPLLGGDEPWWRRVAVLRAAAVVAGVVIVGVALFATVPASSSGPDLTRPAPVPSVGATSAPAPAPSLPPTSSPTTGPVSALAGAGCAPVAAPAADPDGDGCGQPVAVEGTVVTVGEQRYAVGQPGDRLAAGDWDCDGAATVALLRPATGEVFVFEGWSSPGTDLTVSAATVVPGAVDLVPDSPDGGDCPALLAVGAAGERTEVVL